jgi:Ca2+-binding RTX toxin-like protein
LLNSSSTANDSSQAALRTVLAEWTNTANNYNTRITNLRAGISGIRLQAGGAGATVFDDGASVDTMTGGTETDWYFSSAIDIITDLAIGELVDTLV